MLVKKIGVNMADMAILATSAVCWLIQSSKSPAYGMHHKNVLTV